MPRHNSLRKAGLPAYDQMRALWQDGDFVLWRGLDADRSPILVLAPVAERPTPAKLARLEHEYALQADLDPAWAARPIRLDRHGGRPILVLEDPGGEPLESRLGNLLEPAAFLPLAVALAETLRRVHAAGLIHKDLKPANVLADESRVFLTGFGIASRLPREYQAPEPPEVIAGTLAYMAPEQTGRMNRAIDGRADLYALGIIFYQLLTGILPFSASDPMEWIHCHVARQPIAPADLVPAVPAAISSLVMKLLAKAADERYQTAAGLLADLRRCLAPDGLREAFPLGTQDAPDRLRIPERLYGREGEIDALQESLTRVAAGGGPELVLVSGYAGVGKSSLVHELHKALVLPRGLFGSGKFDQYRHDTPYGTLAQALRDLVRPLLAKDEAGLAPWRAALAAALGASGGVLAGLVPELELILGPQPPVPDLAPREAENRFLAVLARFLGVFARPEHPLVLFLDDLQWLDGATYPVLLHLSTHPDLRHLLLIGAYRDNEVGPSHPLRFTLEELRRTGAALRDIVLRPLRVADLERLLADSLRCEPAQAEPLAGLVHEKTGGNPFFAIQFLTSLQEEGLLRFDAQAGAWTWDLEGIRAKAYTDNVVDLMVGKLSRLPPGARLALQELACLGNAAEAPLLALVHGRSERQTEADLWEAIRAGFVLTGRGSYRFVHDRVQEAAYALVPAEERPDRHLRIGRLLLSSWPRERVEERVFDVVGQFNRGSGRIKDPREKAQLCRLNALAGRRAKAAVAPAAARDHLAQAAALLPPAAWDKDYAGTFALHLDWAECEHLAGNVDAADQLFDKVLARARDLVDKARCHRLRSRLYQTAGRLSEALEIIVHALGLLGLPLPDSDPELLAAAEREMDSLGTRLTGPAIARLADLPKATDPVGKMLIGLLVEGLMPAYAARPPIFPLLSAKAVSLSLHYGNSLDSCLAYYSHAVVLIAFRWDLPAAVEFSELALALLDHFADPRPRGGILVGHGGLVLPWRRHISEAIPYLERGLAALLEVGDFPSASHCTMLPVWAVLEQGESLEHLVEASEKYAAVAQQTHNPLMRETVLLCRRLAASLKGQTRPPESFDGEGFSTADCLERFGQASWHTGIAYCRVMQQIAAYLYGRYREALGLADEARPVLGLMMAMQVAASNYVYRLLTLAALYPQATEEEQGTWAGELAEGLARLGFWAENCPENFASRHAMVAAEVARIEGRVVDAEERYEEAIRSARDNGFVHMEALANELAARFYLGRGLETAGYACLRNACAGYLRWGALGKARALEREYPQLAEPDRAASVTIGASLEQLDVATVVKASQAVSGEIVLDRLIETLMAIVLQHAGADRGLLLLPEGESYRVAAEATTGREDVKVSLASSPGASVPLPESVLRYVARTRENVLLDDGLQPHLFSEDPYLGEKAPRSILCLPLVKQARLVGILYLENRLTSRVFTRSRVAVLELLASQAAISLENALLYTGLREREARFRRLVDANIIGIFFADTRGEITDANDAFLRMSGYGRDELTAGQLRWADLTPLEYREADEKAVAEARRNGACTPYEKEFLRRDGTRIPVLVGGAFLEGSTEHIVAFVLDLTEHRRAESERQAREAAEAANRAKSEFLAAMSHELRSPLNTILGFTRLMGRDPGLPDQVREDLGLILKSGEHLHTLVNQVLDLAKIEAGQATLSETGFDLPALLDDLENLFTRQARSKGLDFFLERGSGIPPLIEGDPVKLRQVLINLLGNAIKFTQSGSVRLRVDAVPGGAGERLAFAVTDTGPGIAPAELARLGQAFVQAEAGRRAAEGTGLGLAICRNFVRLMGGELQAESRLGQGTRFQFDLPLRPAQPAPTERRRGPVIGLAPGEPPRRVLVADDRPEARQLLMRLLAGVGLETRTAADGQEAVDLCRSWSPDLVWMDMRMPVLDGRAAIRQIKTLPHVPVIIVLTASSFEEEREEILTTGCEDFLRKPFQEEEIFTLLERHLGIRFLRADEEPAGLAPFPAEMRLAALPPHLRAALRQALVSLDTEAVAQALSAIRPHDALLASFLAQQAEEFQYDRMLGLLQGVERETDI